MVMEGRQLLKETSDLLGEQVEEPAQEM